MSNKLTAEDRKIAEEKREIEKILKELKPPVMLIHGVSHIHLSQVPYLIQRVNEKLKPQWIQEGRKEVVESIKGWLLKNE